MQRSVSPFLEEFAAGDAKESGPDYEYNWLSHAPEAAAHRAVARDESSFAEGIECGRRNAQVEHAANLERMRELHQNELNELRSRSALSFLEAVAGQLSVEMQETRTALADRLSELLMTVLEPAMTNELLQKLVDETSAAVLELRASTIAITGPARLVEPLKSCLTVDIVRMAPGLVIEIHEALREDMTISVIVENAEFEARVGACIARLRDAIQ